MEVPDTYADEILASLDTITADPYVTRMLDAAIELEQLVNADGTSTPEDRKAFISQLDSEWAFTGKTVNLSGYATFPDPEREGRLKKSYYDDTPMVSDGFCFIPDHIVSDDGEVIAEQFRVGFHLVYDTDATRYVGAALFDEVSVVYPEASREMVEQRLRYFYPEIVEIIDGIVMNCEDEEEALQDLKSVVLTIDRTQEADLQFLSDMQQYLEAVLEFDQAVPYAVTITGPCYAISPDGGHVKLAPQSRRGLATIKHLLFVAGGEQDMGGESTVAPYVELVYHQEAPQKQPVTLLVPVTSLAEVSSLRRRFYTPS